MTIKRVFKGIYFLSSLFFLFNAMSVSAAPHVQIRNLIKQLQKINLAVNSQTLTPPTPPIAATQGFGTWGTGAPSDAFVMTGVNLASNMKTIVDSRQNGQPLACQGGLQFINVGLVGASVAGGWGCTFNITASPTLQKLAQQGLFVVVTTYQQSGQNMAAVSLTDVSGNVFAQTTLTLPAGQGFTWINIGYNKNDTLNPLKPNQVYVNWIPVMVNKPIASWYQDQGTATAASTASIPVATAGASNPQTTPPTPSKQVTTLTPPTPPIAATQGFGTWGTGAPSDAFVMTGVNLASNMKTIVDSRQNGQPLACQGGLQFINVGLVGASVAGGWGCTFNITASPTLQKLAQQGLFVVVTTYQQSGQNMAAVSLTDVSGNVFAQTTLTLPAGQGFTWINIGYNKNDTLNPLKPNQVYVNWIPVMVNKPIASWYQDQGTATAASTASIPVATTGASNPQTTPPTSSTVTTTLTPPKSPIPATSPLQWSDSMDGVGVLPSDWPAVATSSAKLGLWPVATIQNNQPVSCAQGLQTLYVDLMSEVGNGVLSCQFDITASPILQKLATQGLYIAVQVLNVNVSAGTSTITVSLTDVGGNLFAQTAANLASSVGATYICAGFNTNPFYAGLVAPAQPKTQTCVNLVQISDSSRIFYQQGTTTTPLLGGLTVPTIPFILSSANISNNCKFTGPGLSDLAAKAVNVLSATPFSCQGGLHSINVGLTDTTGCFLSFNFDGTILYQPALKRLVQNGMYIGVSTIASSNTVVVTLMDNQNNVYAEGSIQLTGGTGGGIQSWNLGLNTTDSNTVDGTTSLGYNGIQLGQTVLYQQLEGQASAPEGAVMPPQPAQSSLVLSQISPY